MFLKTFHSAAFYYKYTIPVPNVSRSFMLVDELWKPQNGTISKCSTKAHWWFCSISLVSSVLSYNRVSWTTVFSQLLINVCFLFLKVIIFLNILLHYLVNFPNFFLSTAITISTSAPPPNSSNSCVSRLPFPLKCMASSIIITVNIYVCIYCTEPI